MKRTLPTPPDWLPAVVDLLKTPGYVSGPDALPSRALDAFHDVVGCFPSEFESSADASAAYYWLEVAEVAAALGPLPPLVPSVYRDGAEVAPESVPPAVALLIGAEIAEGAGIGSLTIGGTMWAWD